MSGTGPTNRESKKQQLRRQIVSSPSQPVRPGRQPEVDGEEAARREFRKAKRRRMTILAVVLLLIGGCGGYWFYYQRNYRYTSYETAWQTDINEGSLVGYESFGTNVLKYTKDGASYTDNKGQNVWTESYEMKSPITAVNGDYAAIADRQGNSIYIVSVDGKQGQASTVLPISRIAVSGTGVVAAVLEDSTSSYITFFAKDGTQLDVTVKTTMGGDGYPMDISLSGDGTQLMCSYAHITNGELKTRVVFYDFSEVGKNVPNRLVGGFDEEFEGTMVPEVTYMDEPYSCAFSGNGLTFFSSRNLASPEVVAQVPIEEEIQSVFHSDKYAAAVVRNTMGEFANRLLVYEKDGTPVMSAEFNYEYTHADIDGDLIILYNEDSCRIFNTAGVEKLYATFDFAVSKIRRGRMPDTLIVTGPQQMREIKLR
ncbi:MAG: DUF5711 family protein [Eubacteriales bacterium]|nr:DUF5711 family protein [Eubacteriales bacterium]